MRVTETMNVYRDWNNLKFYIHDTATGKVSIYYRSEQMCKQAIEVDSVEWSDGEEPTSS